MKVAGLFAGIGGLEQGLRAAGHTTSLFCEIWEPARQVLATRFPNIPCERDVTCLESLPDEVEMIAAGFPCQDLSQAGLTAGISGTKSGLVGNVFRLLDERRVPWVVLENVSFMLHLDRGRALNTLIEAFESRGYRWAYRVVNTLAFLPQRRERVLFVATTTDVDPAAVLLSDEAFPTESDTRLTTHAHGFYWTEGVRGLGWAPNAVPTLKNGSTIGIASPPAVLMPNGDIVTPDIKDAERLQGFASDWTQPAETIARPSIRWSLIGNAVSVPVAHWLGLRLSDPGSYEKVRDRKLSADRWPRAARSDGTQRWAVEINSFPVYETRPSLVEFLQHKGKLLSARATRGFLARTERSTLRFVHGFQDCVRRHLTKMENLEARDSSRIRFASVAAE